MFSRFRSSVVRLVLIIMAVAVFLPALAVAETNAGLTVQLLADRKNAGPGGTVSYHLVYHNASNQTISGVQFKLNVPKGLEPDEYTGGNWDAASGVLLWKVKEIPVKSADMIHFKLKVNADVKQGKALDLVGIVEAGGGISLNLSPVRVTAGNQIDQPFFIGYPDGKFHPEGNLSRAETAAVVARILKLEQAEAPAVEYADVDNKHWAYLYIVKVTQAGYMEGDNKKFRPEAPITRAELTALVLRMRGVQAVPVDGFGDLKGHWAEQIVGTAKRLQFIDGLADGFEPNTPIRRDSAAKLIATGLSRGPLKDGDTKVIQHFPDVIPSDWSFGWVEEAAMTAHEAEIRSDGNEHLIRYLPDQTQPL